MIRTVFNLPEPHLRAVPLRRVWPLAVVVTTMLVMSSCTGEDDDGTDNRSTAVCDGKLHGDVFRTLVGGDGVASEETHDFSPKEWTAGGRCYLYGKDHSVRIDYLWNMETTSSGAGSFMVGSANGYVGADRARVVIPCAVTGSAAHDDGVLEVEVKDMPPTRILDDDLREAFTSAATIAARYLGGEVFKCSAVQSRADIDSASPSPSGS
ncbi:hypothetical protein ACIRJM_43775 [Streptomyces sp. NPDC102405]|uniref:hypothetical protein n=1 Tax=Streptomyces sp. NPDC102405 TaxID=3366170 RepID=UPI00381DF265